METFIMNKDAHIDVLILIIMENTHGVLLGSSLTSCTTSLNPYYNGKYSWSHIKHK